MEKKSREEIKNFWRRVFQVREGGICWECMGERGEFELDFVGEDSEYVMFRCPHCRQDYQYDKGLQEWSWRDDEGRIQRRDFDIAELER